MPARLRAYVTAYLLHEDRVLMLRRSEDRSFSAGRWTGVGGRVEPEDEGNLESALLREIEEETGLGRTAVGDLRLRVLLTQPEDGDIVVLAFYSGRSSDARVRSTNEGELRWVDRSDLHDLDLIENARFALNRILDRSDDAVHLGVWDPTEPGRRTGADFETGNG